MIDFLKEINFNDEDIKKIVEYNTTSTLDNLSCNNINCLKIINYLKEIGVKNIVDLLTYEIDVFLLTFTDFIKKIRFFNVPVFVDAINDDYSVIREIYNFD